MTDSSRAEGFDLGQVNAAFRGRIGYGLFWHAAALDIGEKRVANRLNLIGWDDDPCSQSRYSFAAFNLLNLTLWLSIYVIRRMIPVTVKQMPDITARNHDYMNTDVCFERCRLPRGFIVESFLRL